MRYNHSAKICYIKDMNTTMDTFLKKKNKSRAYTKA